MFKVLDGACKPTKGSKYSACVDLYAREDVVIGAGETVKVPLGVCVKLDDDIDFVRMCGDSFQHFMRSHYLQLEPRSSLRTKGFQAGTGIIDLDYKDEICIILHNPMKKDWIKSFVANIVHKYFGVICETYFNDDSNHYINKDDKIAQIMLCEHKSYLFGIETDEERKGGFGSTGE